MMNSNVDGLIKVNKSKQSNNEENLEDVRPKFNKNRLFKESYVANSIIRIFSNGYNLIALVIVILLSVIIVLFVSVSKKYDKSNERVNIQEPALNITSKYFQFIKKKVDCKYVYIRMMNRKPATTWPPPKSPPKDLYDKFTQNGEMPITQTHYFAQKYSGSNAFTNKWTVPLIEGMMKNHKLGGRIGGYFYEEEKAIDDAITKYSITGKDVAVIGSENPWVEAIIATKNPRSITTIEYGEINSTIPYLKTYTPDKFAEQTLKKEIQFDFVVSHSSMEHSGLGRYGDALNPDGDIHAAEEVWCMLKDGGYFLIGLPYTRKSFIRWNADRNYGPERMKYFAANFEQIEFFGTPWVSQIPLLLRKRLINKMTT